MINVTDSKRIEQILQFVDFWEDVHFVFETVNLCSKPGRLKLQFQIAIRPFVFFVKGPAAKWGCAKIT